MAPPSLLHASKTPGDEISIVLDQIWDTACDASVHVKRYFAPRSPGLIDPVRYTQPAKVPDNKPRILVVGSGWSAHAFLKIIETDIFEVVCVSPRPYFVFTPMLPCTVVGTVEYGSIVEPIRLANPLVEFIEGEVIDIIPSEKRCVIESKVHPKNATLNFYFDHIVYSVGAKVSTLGVEGALEYCNFIKEIEDVKKLKSRIMSRFEAASLPGVGAEDIYTLLTFCVIGGGPTGCEFIGELTDFIQREVPKLYPRLQEYVKIVLLSSGVDILSTFDAALREKALQTFKSRNVNIQQ